MQIQPLWAYDLIDHVQFWQTEQGFDTIDIHEQGSFFWVTCFLECCEESCACQQPLSVPCYQAQTLASNLAKSQKKPRGQELSPEDKAENTMIASIRILVEH